MLEIFETPIAGLIEIQPKIWGDARGFFLEIFSSRRFIHRSGFCPFVQDASLAFNAWRTAGFAFSSKQSAGQAGDLYQWSGSRCCCGFTSRLRNVRSALLSNLRLRKKKINYGFHLDLPMVFQCCQGPLISSTNVPIFTRAGR